MPLAEDEIIEWRRLMNSVPSLARGYAELQRGHQAITRQLADKPSIEDLNDKHHQNQIARKEDREFFQRLFDNLSAKLERLFEIVTNVRIENARWNIGAGILTAVAIEAMKHFWPGK